MNQTENNYLIWRLCNWTGLVFLAGYCLTWGVMGYNTPPYEPGISQQDLYLHYTSNSMRIRTAFVLSVFFMPMYFVFSSVVSRVMQRIEGPNGPLSVIEQMGGATTVVVGCIAGVSFMTAAYRPAEWSAETIRQLHDFGWLYFDTTYMCTSLQMFAIAIVFLMDKRETPLIPRWLSWFTVLGGLSFFPLTLLPFFYSGPFAWSGVFCFWISLGWFFVWVLLFAIYLFKAIDRIEAEDKRATGLEP